MLDRLPSPARLTGAVTAVRDIWPHGGTAARGLPPGQGLARTFPRFGVHLADPNPEIPPRPVIEIGGAVGAPFELSLADLETLERRTLVADFHCVAGWSVRDRHWEGVPFRTVWKDLIAPRVEPGARITHLVFAGLDRYRSTLTLEDALGDDVLIADRLDGAPLPGDHGAPARLVSPRQYGYMNTKHLCRIEVHTRAPSSAWYPSGIRAFGLSLVAPHPRARVADEERHGQLPGWSVRFLYQRVVLPLLATTMRPAEADGSRLPNTAHTAHPWRIREIAPDFAVEDVWALPVHGGAEDFETLVDEVVHFDPTDTDSLAARALWRARDVLGTWLHLGRVSVDGGRAAEAAETLPIPGTDETSLAGRLPEDLRGSAVGLDHRSLPFQPLYRTRDEFAAELSNRTVHGVLHLAWVPDGQGRYQGQMAVYVKPRGALGQGYMELIKPFRHHVVYPALMRQIERTWNARA